MQTSTAEFTQILDHICPFLHAYLNFFSRFPSQYHTHLIYTYIYSIRREHVLRTLEL